MWEHEFETWKKNNVDQADCEANSGVVPGCAQIGVDRASGPDHTALMCAQCGRTKTFARGEHLPMIGWCGCPNNARTGA